MRHIGILALSIRGIELFSPSFGEEPSSILLLEVVGANTPLIDECQDDRVHQEHAKLFHEVQRQSRPPMNRDMIKSHIGVKPSDLRGGNTVGAQQGIPQAQEGIDGISGWAPSTLLEIEGHVLADELSEPLEIGVGSRSL